jgi:hypothetical protein
MPAQHTSPAGEHTMPPNTHHAGIHPPSPAYIHIPGADHTIAGVLARAGTRRSRILT